MRGRFAIPAKVRRRGHNATPEMAQPNMVHGDSSGERILRTSDPASKRSTASGAHVRVRFHGPGLIGYIERRLLFRFCVSQCLLGFLSFLACGLEVFGSFI